MQQVKDDAVQCFFQKHSASPACSGGVSDFIYGYYRHHRAKESPQFAVDVVPVCAAHGDWHSKHCNRCGIQPRRY